jgi:hypothetical protein
VRAGELAWKSAINMSFAIACAARKGRQALRRAVDQRRDALQLARVRTALELHHSPGEGRPPSRLLFAIVRLINFGLRLVVRLHHLAELIHAVVPRGL